MNEDDARLMRFVLEMRQEGVTHPRALAGLELTPRTLYAPPHLEGMAMENVNLPLAHAQTMTKPALVGRMIAALDPQESDSVLEIGTGSGYQAAVLAELARKVVTLERWRDLLADARQRLGRARLMRVYAHVADGALGWAEDAPYDRIIINASVPVLPDALIAQLRPGGTLVAPVGDRLIRFRDGQSEDLGPVKFPPLEHGVPDEAPAIAPAPDSEPEHGA